MRSGVLNNRQKLSGKNLAHGEVLLTVKMCENPIETVARLASVCGTLKH